MEWVAALAGRVVGLDTAPLIYFIEEHPSHIAMLDPFFKAVARGGIRVVTSMVTLCEVLVHPLRQEDTRLATQYRDILLNSAGVETLPVTAAVAELAAQFRAVHRIRTPDAIQLATAVTAGATAFLTNDANLPNIPQLDLLVLDQLKSHST